MRRRVLALGTLVAALLAGVTSCGIPGQTDVRVDGRGPLPGDKSDEGSLPVPPRREAADDVRQFVQNFLEAPAGELTGAYERVNEYIAHGSRLRPTGDETVVNVVRLTGTDPIRSAYRNGTWGITVSVQHVGVLRADGTLDEPVAGERTYTFTVGKIEGNAGTNNGASRGFYVFKSPPLLLMTVTALNSYYQPRTIYFWDRGRTALVPDLRYLPRAVPAWREATEVLGWLIGGPARWLALTAARLPEGTEAIGNVPDPQPNGRLEINLSVPAEAVNDEEKVDQLFRQLAWSLPDRTSSPLDRPRDLELKIQGKRRKMANIEAYRGLYPLYQVMGEPGRFGIHHRQVRSLDNGREAVPMAADLNHGVVSAAMNRDGDRAWVALVTGEGDGPRRLRTGAGPVPVRRLRHSAESYRSLGQPVWLKSSDPARPAGLVVADGKLKRFDADAILTNVSVPNIPAGRRLLAVAAALDGHRIALIVQGGGLYVAALNVESDSVSVGPARQLATSLTNLTAVSWNGEDSLVVAGRNGDGRVAILGTSVDAGRESVENSQEVTEPVIQLAAYPDNPVVKAVTGNVLYSTGTAIYSDAEPINLDPAAGASGAALTAPFYYY